jgi:hypothetical protein
MRVAARARLGEPDGLGLAAGVAEEFVYCSTARAPTGCAPTNVAAEARMQVEPEIRFVLVVRLFRVGMAAFEGVRGGPCELRVA